jgi:hypothetical protein
LAVVVVSAVGGGVVGILHPRVVLLLVPPVLIARRGGIALVVVVLVAPLLLVPFRIVHALVPLRLVVAPLFFVPLAIIPVGFLIRRGLVAVMVRRRVLFIGRRLGAVMVRRRVFLIRRGALVGRRGFGVAGELVATDTRLLLSRGLVDALDLALVEASLDTESEGVWDRFGDADDLVDSEIAKRGIGDFRWDSEESLGNGSNTRVFVVQTGDEAGGLAVEVRLVVEGTLREDGTLTRVEDVGNESSAVLLDEANFKVRSGQHVQKFCGAGVIVRRGHPARP